MIEIHWTILFCAYGVGIIFGFFVAAMCASSGMASRCEECEEYRRDNELTKD